MQPTEISLSRVAIVNSYLPERKIASMTILRPLLHCWWFLQNSLFRAISIICICVFYILVSFRCVTVDMSVVHRSDKCIISDLWCAWSRPCRTRIYPGQLWYHGGGVMKLLVSESMTCPTASHTHLPAGPLFSLWLMDALRVWRHVFDTDLHTRTASHSSWPGCHGDRCHAGRVEWFSCSIEASRGSVIYYK